MGRGGELAEFAPDLPPLRLPETERLGAADLMALQLPVSLVGYHTQSVDDALSRVMNALSERDTRIAVLEQRVAELLASRLQARHELHAGLVDVARAEHRPETPEQAVEPMTSEEPSGLGTSEEPARAAELRDPVNPAESGQPSGVEGPEGPEEAAEPEKVAEFEGIAEPEKVAGPEEAAEPEEATEPEEAAEPEKVGEAEEAAESEEAGERENSARSEAVSDGEPEGLPKSAQASTGAPVVEHDDRSHAPGVKRAR